MGEGDLEVLSEICIYFFLFFFPSSCFILAFSVFFLKLVSFLHFSGRFFLGSQLNPLISNNTVPEAEIGSSHKPGGP